MLATRDLPAVPFARVPVTETWTAKRVLDAGVHGVMFPFVSTPALARQAADACRYPPAGRRGSGASLATSGWPEPDGYYDSADRNVLVVVIVEEAAALAHVDEIAATPGVDVVFVGTGDLSFSLGLRGQQDHPRVEEAAAAVLAAAQAPRQDCRPAGGLDRANTALHRTGLPVLPGAVGARALRKGRAAVPRTRSASEPTRRQRTFY